MIEAMLASDNPSGFIKNLLKLIKIDDEIRYEKLQYDISRKTGKI